MKQLAVSENRWVPGGDHTKLATVCKQVKGILNKMTPQRFEKLSTQLCDIEMESTEMQSELIALVFEKVSSSDSAASLASLPSDSERTRPLLCIGTWRARIRRDVCGALRQIA